MTDTIEADLTTDGPVLDFTEARVRYAGVIFAFVSRRIRPLEDAEDVSAQVFVDAYRYWDRRKGDPKLWLLGIARRKVADHRRRQRPWWTFHDADAPIGDAMADLVAGAERREVVAAMRKLPDPEREALLLQVLEDLTIAEVAAVLGRSPKATNSLLQRARARLRRLLGQENPL
ncbi:MAG: RNA polymerase sigma factor [Fimbriimonas sp.]